MSAILKPRDEAQKYTVRPGDTLESIALAKCPTLGAKGWELVARFNWGTARKEELLRVLIETIGVKADQFANASALAKPHKLVLAPDSDLDAKILVPEVWTKGAVDLLKKHKVKVKPIKVGYNAVRIEKLDPWFIPGKEQCELEWGLEGDAERATKLSVEVFGNKYCDATAYNDGLGTYADPADLIDEPIYAADISTQINARSKAQSLTTAWKGEASTAKGVLGRKTGTAGVRHINVAFSPYTVHFRYFKVAGDAKARLALEPFWPQFKETPATHTVTVDHATKRVTWTNAAAVDRGCITIADKNGQVVHRTVLDAGDLASGSQTYTWNARYDRGILNSKFGDRYLDDDKNYEAKVTTFTRAPDPATLKIKWTVRGDQAADRLKHGVLWIRDKRNKVVFVKPLPKALLKKQTAAHEVVWDGNFPAGIKNSKNGTAAILEDMPYRAEIEAHNDFTDAEGLGVAAMHTEVRLHVHAENVLPKDPAYIPESSKASLRLGLAPLVPGTAPAETDGTKWYQHQLALAGFHPGPIDGTSHADFQLALKEFKRSVPADASVAAPNFTRLTIDTNENAATKTAIKKMRGSDKRAWFGDPAAVASNSETPDFTNEQAAAKLREPAQELVVWVDDRQYYTGSRGAPKDHTNANFLSGTPAATAFGLGDYRGRFNNGEARVTADEAAIPRPWIPLQADLQLLGRDKGLLDPPASFGSSVLAEQHQQKVRRLLGPLRVDWSFDELEPPIAEIDAAAYDKRFTRSRRYVAWALDACKGTHNRKDTGRQAIYRNCEETKGGIRPTALNTYYEKAFGTGARSLGPCKAAADSTTETVATVVHEHLAAAQTANTDLFEPRIGTAGVFFNPSRIAGDGYRVRAEVQFKKFTGYEFPNLEALEKRYPVPPQAHSARLRLWRKSSMRGYLVWAPAGTGHWPGFAAAFRNQHKPAYLYFVHEGGAATEFNISDVYDPGTPLHVDRYKKIVRYNVTQPALRSEANMSLKSDFIWPWSDRDNYGWPWPSEAASASDYTDEITTGTWRKFREALLLGIVREVEKKGFMRGHLFVEFKSSGPCRLRVYRCNAPANHKHYMLRKVGAPNVVGTGCETTGCGGTLVYNNRQIAKSSLSLPAVGIPLGATWLFTSGEADVWVHEVGHHRHLQHASSAPGAAADYHDSEQNTTVLKAFAAPAITNQGTAGAKSYSYQVVAFDNTIPLSDLSAEGSTASGNATLTATNYNRITWTAVAGANKYKVYRSATDGNPATTGFIGETASLSLDDKGLAGNRKDIKGPAHRGATEKQWDRHCIMSYAGPYYPLNKEYFCGKCVLRQRGWKVSTLGLPAPAVTEP